jgi:acetoacetyl-CoA synthetase
MLGSMTGDEATTAGGGHGHGYGETLWTPTAETIKATQTARYQEWLAARGIRTSGYDELWRWSTDNPGAFWDSLWDYFGVLGERGGGPALEAGTMPDVRWFPGATLNYARNMLRTAHTDPDRLAIIALNERGAAGDGGAVDGEDGGAGRGAAGGADGMAGGAGGSAAGGRTYTYAQLAAEVARVAAGLRDLGVRRGDRVVGLVPNIPEAAIALLATASIGAIWSSCSPDFGTRSVVDRFAQIEPAVLIAVDGYAYNGKDYPRASVVAEIAAALPTLKAIVTISLLSPPGETAAGAGEFSAGPGSVAWESLGLDRDHQEMEFEEVPFEHPLWVLYSSGTTGLPKPIVHGHGGIVLEHLKALAFHLDLGPGDRFSWYTTTGWMMWNFLVGGLLAGATTVLYDGAATYPQTGRLWSLAAETGLSYLGVGAPYLTASRKAGLRPGAEYDLTALRGIGSTGSPLPPECFTWVYDAVKPDLILGSLSGGTDMCTGFVGSSPLLPVRSGVIAGPCLGAKVEAFDPDGRPVTGQVGELVLTVPLPSMPVGFWNDPDGSRYRDAYYADFPGVWRHGDWIEILPDGGCVIYGRSDATLNRGGVRMGTSEFYRVVEAFAEVADSLVVDTGRLGAEGRLVLYVALAAGVTPDDELVRRVKAALRTQLSPRHVPDEIIVVPGIPRTLSGKKLEIPVRKILLGTPVEQAADPSALANPEVLGYFAARPQSE